MENSPIAADGSNNHEDSILQELEKDSIVVRLPSSEVNNLDRYADCLVESLSLKRNISFFMIDITDNLANMSTRVVSGVKVQQRLDLIHCLQL